MNAPQYIAVIVGTHAEFDDWRRTSKTLSVCAALNLIPVEITLPQDLFGRRFAFATRIGTWQRNPDINQIEAMLPAQMSGRLPPPMIVPLRACEIPERET